MPIDFSFTCKASKLMEWDRYEKLGSPKRFSFHQLVILIDEALGKDLRAVKQTIELFGEFGL